MKHVKLFEAFVNEQLVNEAFKSSKLRNLINMHQSGSNTRKASVKDLAKGLYGLSKIRLDQVEDSDLRDYPADEAYGKFLKDKSAVVFYIVDNEKENPYATNWERDKYGVPMLRPGILALTRGKEFLAVDVDKKNNRHFRDLRGKNNARTLGSEADLEMGMRHMARAKAVGGNKENNDEDWNTTASGIHTVERAAELADRAIVFYINGAKKSAKDLINQRANAQSGAVAFKHPSEIRRANLARYEEILSSKDSKLPLDKMVKDAVEEISNQIKDALAKDKRGEYGDVILFKSIRGFEVTIPKAQTHISNILNDYDRYVDSMDMVKKEEEKSSSLDNYSASTMGYHKKEAASIAKRIKQRVKEIKTFEYGVEF